MTFREYVRKRRITDTPAGDFVADCQADRNMPNVKTLLELEGYLQNARACSEASAAAAPVWRAYEAVQRRG